jgi:hypothetical protein
MSFVALAASISIMFSFAVVAAERPAAITSERAEALVWALPEIKAWAKYIGAESEGKAHAMTIVEPEAPEIVKGKRYWSVNFGEDDGDHTHRWQTFMVRLDGAAILVDTDTPDEYLTLKQWRVRDHPMDRIRGSQTP